MDLPPRVSRLSRRAFTLIELLVVVGIIAILIGILLPSFGRAQEMARTIQCAANLRSIGQASAAYSASNDGTIVPYRLDLSTGIYQWANILVDKKYLDAPRGQGQGT